MVFTWEPFHKKEALMNLIHSICTSTALLDTQVSSISARSIESGYTECLQIEFEKDQ